ncbi:MAG: RMD1 family protein [Sulfurospirillaceae bacterium]|nr:RMD1 family protein [Sulfurospirillaceae bacterium]
MKKLALASIYLPNVFLKKEIETALNCSFKKSIEKTFYANLDDKFIVYTQFNVITFINYSRNEIVEMLSKLNIKNASEFEKHYIYQDYPVVIDNSLISTCNVNNDFIVLKEYEPLSLVIVALVVSQSVGLEKYEQDLDVYFRQSRKLIDLADNFAILNRPKLRDFVKNLTRIQYEMVVELFLLDKPNILWDNEKAENIYNILASSLEIKDRFEIVSFKLNGLKEDIDMVLDLANQKQDELLDWIIIVLIFIAVGIMVLEIFAH